MKAILLLQTVSISKILDVETDNVATAEGKIRVVP